MHWLLLIAAAVFVSAPACGDYVVAPTGSDAAAGSESAPFATLARAQKAVRQLRAGGDEGTITVLVRGGTYRLDEPVTFLPEDSGTVTGKTIYAAWPGEKPVFSGGEEIHGLTVGADGVWRADMGDHRPEQLYVNGRRATRARTPNEYYWYARGPVARTGSQQADAGPDPIERRAFRAFAHDLEPLRGLTDDELRRVTMVVYNSWEVSRHHIAAVDHDTGQVTMTGPYFVDFFHFARPRYYLIDCPEALDVPGEWTVDTGGMLAYLPREGETPDTARIEAPRLSHLVVFAGRSATERVEHVELRGLSFQHSAYVLPPEGESSPQAACKIPAAIMANYASDVVLDGCSVAHTGDYAVWFRDGCRNCTVQQCELTDLGAGGVRIGGIDLAQAIQPDHATGNITVDNCIIHDGGHVWNGAVGVFVAHSGDNRITHNDIAGLGYTGISVGWRWGYGDVPSKRNIVADNRIHHLGDILADMGGIYTLGEAPGTVLRGNVIHDIDGHGASSMSGIYNDNSTADMLMEQNLIYNVRDGGYKLGSGRDNVVRDNIFVAGRNAHCYFCLYYPERDKHVAVTLERNIFYGVPSADDGACFLGRHPGEFIRFARNLYFAPDPSDLRICEQTFNEWQAAGYDEGSIVADPGFQAPQQHDYRLAQDSPAHAIGFRPFDFGGAGVYGDPAWVAKARDREFPPMRTVAPDPPPFTISDGFESVEEGGAPLDAYVHTENEGDAIAVCTLRPATGRQCLEVRDKPGLKYAFNPHFYYQPNHSTGRTRVQFDLRLGPGAHLYHEWREYPGHPYFDTGPRLSIASGRLVAGGRDLLRLPEHEWVHFELECDHGHDATDTWCLTVTLPGKPPQTFAELPIGSPGAYRRLTWLGFVSEGDAEGVYWLDNLSIEHGPAPTRP